jgi:hypothetical protein
MRSPVLGFGSALKLIVPSPVPVAPAVIVSQDGLSLLALHWQPGAVRMSTPPLPPCAGSLSSEPFST